MSKDNTPNQSGSQDAPPAATVDINKLAALNEKQSEQIAEQAQQITGLMNTIAAQNKTIAGLSRQLEAKVKAPEAKPKPVIPSEPFMSFGKRYKFLTPQFRLKGDVITATDAMANQELLDTLVVSKSGNIECLDKEDEE